MAQQSIAIIGASSAAGSAMAFRLHGKGFRLLLVDEDQEHLYQMRKELVKGGLTEDLELYECKHSACWDSDIILLSVHDDALEEVLNRIREVSTRKIVIVTAAGGGEALADDKDPMAPGVVSSTDRFRMVREKLPHSRVVFAKFGEEKAESALIGERAVGAVRRVNFWGDDIAAVEAVVRMAETAGFDAVAGEPKERNQQKEK